MKQVSTMHILDKTGDTRIEWNPTNKDEVKMAKAAFKTAQDKKMLIYKINRDGSRGELLRTFDPTAERIIATPQTVGG